MSYVNWMDKYSLADVEDWFREQWPEPEFEAVRVAKHMLDHCFRVSFRNNNNNTYNGVNVYHGDLINYNPNPHVLRIGTV